MAQAQKPRALLVILTRKAKLEQGKRGRREKEKFILVEVSDAYCAAFAGSGCKEMEYNLNCIEIPMQINSMIPCREPQIQDAFNRVCFVSTLPIFGPELTTYVRKC